MGILTSLAALKYLFSGSGGSGGARHVYVPPSPEQLAAMERQRQINQQLWDDRVEYFWSTHIGHFLDTCGNIIHYVVFDSPNWWWLALLGMLLTVIIFLFFTNPEEENAVTSKFGICFFICCIIGTILLGLLALDSVVMIIRFIIWLFSPVS